MSGDRIDTRMDRRTAVKWMLAAVGSLQGAGLHAAGSQFVSVPASAAAGSMPPVEASAAADAVGGYGKDPDLLRSYLPGELWPLVMTPVQRAAARVLADFILPAQGSSPAASALGVHDFIDEWVSAPYEPCRKDSAIILAGLDRLSEDAQTRFGEALSELSGDRVEPLCRALADMGEVLEPDVKRDTEHTTTAGFFSRFRKLVTIGYFTTPVGMQDLGYVGNRPLISYDGPPAEALRKAGVKL